MLKAPKYNHLANIFCEGCRLKSIVGVIPKEGLAPPTNPSFYMTTTKIFTDACFCGTQLITVTYSAQLGEYLSTIVYILASQPSILA